MTKAETLADVLLGEENKVFLVGQNKIHHNKPTMDKCVGRTKYPRRG